MEKFKTYIYPFLVYCVLNSKTIIIYNEETLVGLSFLVFVFFIIHYYGETIQESLNEKSLVIKSEFQKLGVNKLESLNELFKQHQKLSVLNLGLNKVSNFTIKTVLGTILQGKYALTSLFTQQTERKLKTLSFSKLAIQQQLQQYMANDLLILVYLFFQRLKNKKL